ncbi:alpha/beta hydrolase [Massilia solisilvae]|uniref:Alpha/beta hydrolase n=1 Tax=Massilia solisilvae TaxID=1811225 RepID=A0ABT2BHX0_9BURK|nr:alpha/beta hydrolase [Massilia solisilvae]MCS0608045.1 alpha/beta hydrolase [Massilia solisilvae]
MSSMLPRAARANGWRNAALLAGVGLAASFLYVRAKTRQVEREHPPQGKFIEVDGVRLHYTERGQGPVLVLLHGNMVSSDDYDHSGLVGRAAERYRVIAFDRPGYGYSERPRSTVWTPQAQARLIHHALQEMGVDSALVVGHSWGTLVALSMALDVPDFVRGLVLLSGYYYPSLRLDVPMLSTPAIPILGDLLRYTVSPLLWRLRWPLMAKFMFSPQPVPQRFWDMPAWMMVRPKQLRAVAADSALMVPAAMALARRYPELKVPVALIAGTRDKMADFSHNSERLSERVPEGELTLEPGVGHMTHYAHPEKVLEAIDAMAAKVGEPVQIRNPRAEALARASESGV